MTATPARRLGYVRVSLAREEMISPAIQRAAILDEAKRTGSQITRWIEDLDATGRNFKRRVMEAIAAVEAGEATEIGVYRYDRWGRNALECLANVQRVEDVGGAVVSAMERVDVETAMGRFTRRMAFDLAELQSDQISDNWRAAHASRVERGLPSAGTSRFGYVRLGRVPDPGKRQGYRRDPDDPAGERYLPDPDTAPVLAALYERYAAGEPVRALVRWLNETGVRTAGGGRWTRDSLRLVLTSGFGAGLLYVHDPACKRKPERGKPCGQRVYVPGVHEAVIGPDTWQAYLERAERRRGEHPRLRDPVHPLSGLLYCGATDHRLTVTSDARGLAYRCPRRAEARDCAGAFVRAALAEKTVLAWLSRWAADIEAAAAVSVARDRTVRRSRADLEQLSAQEAVLQGRLARLMTRWASDEHAEEAAYQKARAPILADLEAVRARMAAATQAGKVNAGAWQPLAVGLIAEWPLFSPARRRLMLGELISRIEVYRAGRGEQPRLVIVPVWEA